MKNDPVDGGRQFTFNGENKQTEVRDVNGGLIGEYLYDGEGRRVKKKIYAAGVVSEETVFVYSNGKLIAEYSTAAPAQYPTTSYTVTDQLGSPRVIVNAWGEVVSRRDFMPFGEELAPDTTHRVTGLKYGGADSVRHKFTGYQKDEETGLDFAEARMYESRHARFTAIDPLLASGKSGNPQTFNRYAYVMGNPVRLTDPTGLQAATRVETVYPCDLADMCDYTLRGGDTLNVNLRDLASTTTFAEFELLEPTEPSVSTEVISRPRSEISTLSSVVEAGVFDGLSGIGKGVGNAPAVALNGITDALLSQATLGFNQGRNPFAAPLPFSYNNAREASYGSASGSGAIVGTGLAAGAIFGSSSTLSVVPETTLTNTVTVGRWMGQAEYAAIRRTGMVQEGSGGTTYVAFPANPGSYIGPARPGSLYVEFGVPRTSLQPAGRPDWAQIPGPNSLFARNEIRFGRPAPQMPAATNPCVIMCRTNVP